jgi:glycine/D-amino acid oxidase-like deaminating enzyme
MQTYRLTRDIPVEEGFDILVAGGGPAGSAAAICAARLGAKVLLAEATGCLGGMGTSGLVSTFGPVSDGRRMLVGGFMRELVLAMQQGHELGPHVVPEFLHDQPEFPKTAFNACDLKRHRSAPDRRSSIFG